MSNEPTPTQFAKALARVKAKHPQAPGLPEGYRFDGRYTRPEPVALWFEDAADNRVVPDAAALALCVTTAMEVGAWWEDRIGDVCHVYTITGQRKWLVHTLSRHGPTHSGPFDSLPSAALAMLEVIGGA